MNLQATSTRMKGFALASMVSGYIIGPLLIFGGGGWYLASLTHHRIYIILGVGIAFILTNVLILRNTTKLINFMKKQ